VQNLIARAMFQSTRLRLGATTRPQAPQSIPPVSIHAPAIRRDVAALNMLLLLFRFQSTRLRLGATCYKYQSAPFLHVSIHAPAIRRDRASTGQ